MQTLPLMKKIGLLLISITRTGIKWFRRFISITLFLGLIINIGDMKSDSSSIVSELIFILLTSLIIYLLWTGRDGFQRIRNLSQSIKKVVSINLGSKKLTEYIESELVITQHLIEPSQTITVKSGDDRDTTKKLADEGQGSINQSVKEVADGASDSSRLITNEDEASANQVNGVEFESADMLYDGMSLLNGLKKMKMGDAVLLEAVPMKKYPNAILVRNEQRVPIGWIPEGSKNQMLIKSKLSDDIKVIGTIIDFNNERTSGIINIQYKTSFESISR